MSKLWYGILLITLIIVLILAGISVLGIMPLIMFEDELQRAINKLRSEEHTSELQ